MARADSAPPDTVVVDTAQTVVVPPEPVPEPPRQDSAPVFAPPPVTLPPAEGVYDIASVEKVPELRNRRDVERVARRAYPEFLRDAGGSSEVIVSFVIDRDGRVEPGSIQVLNDVQPAFGDAARSVAERMRFRPAELRGERVRSRVQVPITFRAD